MFCEHCGQCGASVPIQSNGDNPRYVHQACYDEYHRKILKRPKSGEKQRVETYLDYQDQMHTH